MSFDGAFNFIGKTKIGGIFPVMLFVLAIVIAVSYIIMNYIKVWKKTYLYWWKRKDSVPFWY